MVSDGIGICMVGHMVNGNDKVSLDICRAGRHFPPQGWSQDEDEAYPQPELGWLKSTCANLKQGSGKKKTL
jgi:hypothetical protein